jgi:vacuolar-type H+-ATPase subunit B/Vma2
LLFLRGDGRAFGPPHRRVIATDALQVGTASNRDNRDHSLSAFLAARRLVVHGILPFFRNAMEELLFRLRKGAFLGAASDPAVQALLIKATFARGRVVPGPCPQASILASPA